MKKYSKNIAETHRKVVCRTAMSPVIDGYLAASFFLVAVLGLALASWMDG